MGNKILEKYLEENIAELQGMFRPFDVAPFEWVCMEMPHEPEKFAIAIVVVLIPPACTPEVLVDLISMASEELKEPILRLSLVGVQIVFGRYVDNQYSRFYRTLIYREGLEEAGKLKTLPMTNGEISPGIVGTWFESFTNQ